MAPGARLICLVVLSTIGFSRGAIHTYNKEYFYQVGDACIFKGGSEGLYASTPEVGRRSLNPSELLHQALFISRIQTQITPSFKAFKFRARALVFANGEGWKDDGCSLLGVSLGSPRCLACMFLERSTLQVHLHMYFPSSCSSADVLSFFLLEL